MFGTKRMLLRNSNGWKKTSRAGRGQPDWKRAERKKQQTGCKDDVEMCMMMMGDGDGLYDLWAS